MASMGKDACIRIAFKGNLPIAGILTLAHGNKVVYKYGGSNARFHNSGAMPMLFWRAIQESKEAGMEELDLGRSDLANFGLIRFKERLSAIGSTLTIWRGPADISSPFVEDIKAHFAKEVCAHLPDSVLRLAGRLLYRHIG